MKSMCINASVTGWNCMSCITASIVEPPMVIFAIFASAVYTNPLNVSTGAEKWIGASPP